MTKQKSCTWNDVTKANSSHSNETKVEGIKEAPIFPNGEDETSNAQKGC